MNTSKLHSSLRALAVLGLAVTTLASGGDWPEWRGPSRDGTGRETGLLREWAKEGPKLLWKAKEVGSGYSAPSIVGGRAYLLGNDTLQDETVRAFSTRDGHLLWSTRLGKVGKPDQRPNFPAARSTPTVVGDLLYALGSDGDLACVESGSGKIRWQKNLRADFAGNAGQWAYSESPLVDGNTLLCSPGGAEATLLALNRTTGEVLWKTALPEADQAGYSSPIAVDAGGVRQYVQLLQKGLVGVDARSGKLLWRYGRAVSRFGANIPTPLASGALIYTAAAGTGGGAVRLKTSGESVEAEEVYFESKLPTAIGGVVKVGDYLYGTTSQALLCLEFATGKLKWEDRALGAASLCVADGRLFLHGENGEVALVEPSAEGYREKGRFTPADAPKKSNGMEKAWAYPVVADGRLYIREHGALWCYAVK